MLATSKPMLVTAWSRFNGNLSMVEREPLKQSTMSRRALLGKIIPRAMTAHDMVSDISIWNCLLASSRTLKGCRPGCHSMLALSR